jgi:hypothetical protein
MVSSVSGVLLLAAGPSAEVWLFVGSADVRESAVERVAPSPAQDPRAAARARADNEAKFARV